MMTKKITDYKNGENMSLEAIIKLSDFRLAKNGKNFLSLVFEDKSGQIPGKYWDASKEDADSFKVGAVVQLDGKRDIYQGKPQVTINRLGVIDPASVDMSKFIQTAPEKKLIWKANLRTYFYKSRTVLGIGLLDICLRNFTTNSLLVQLRKLTTMIFKVV